MSSQPPRNLIKLGERKQANAIGSATVNCSELKCDGRGISKISIKMTRSTSNRSVMNQSLPKD